MKFADDRKIGRMVNNDEKRTIVQSKLDHLVAIPFQQNLV